MTKNPMKLAACLSVIHAAQTHVEVHPSTAAPTDLVTTEMRAGTLFVTRVTNQLTGMVEISSQQAAAAVLGMPSSFTTSAFSYVFPHAALQHVRLHTGNAAAGSESDSSDATTGSDDSDSSSTTSRSSKSSAENFDGPGLDTETTTNTGTATTYGVDGAVVTVPQHEHYRFRGPAFEAWNLYVYAGGVVVVKKKKALPEGGVEGQDNRGRKCSATFDFDPKHPLFATHTQQLRSKQLTPILAGPSCPKYPGTRPRKPSAAWKRKAADFVAYMLVTFQPWSLTTLLPGPLTWGHFCAFMIELECGKGGVLPSFVSRSTASIIHNVARSLHCKKHCAFLAARYRSRAADLLLKTAWATDVPGVLDRDMLSLQRAAADAIDQLQREADGGRASNAQRAMGAYVENTLRSVTDVLGSTQAGCQPPSSGQGVHVSSTPAVREMVEGIYKKDPGSLPLPTPSAPACDPSVQPAVGGAGAASTDTGGAEPPRLGANTKQLAAILVVVEYLRRLREHRASPTTTPAPELLNMLVTGGPGVGKSFFVKAMDDAIQLVGFRMICAAFTGCAAVQLPRPQTLHSVLNFGGRKKKKGQAEERGDANRPLARLTPAELAALRAKFKDIDVFLIDEVRDLRVHCIGLCVCVSVGVCLCASVTACVRLCETHSLPLNSSCTV